jgi:signal transduction histidine kinase
LATPREGGSEELRLATHLRTLSLLAPGIAHDLRAPINAMAFNLEVMRETLARAEGAAAGPGPRNARLERYSEVLREELDRLHSRLETLLAYLLPTPLRRETIPLATVLREIETLVLPTARKRRISLTRIDPDDLVHLPGGPGPLREALLQVAVAALAEVASGGVRRL